jgi:hypothetical protein
MQREDDYGRGEVRGKLKHIATRSPACTSEAVEHRSEWVRSRPRVGRAQHDCPAINSKGGG